MTVQLLLLVVLTVVGLVLLPPEFHTGVKSVWVFWPVASRASVTRPMPSYFIAAEVCQFSVVPVKPVAICTPVAAASAESWPKVPRPVSVPSPL